MVAVSELLELGTSFIPFSLAAFLVAILGQAAGAGLMCCAAGSPCEILTLTRSVLFLLLALCSSDGSKTAEKKK